MSDHHFSSFGIATFDVAGGLFSPRRKPAAAPARAPKPKSAPPAVSAEEVAELRAELAGLRAEVAELRDAPAAARRRETLKNVVIADMEWRNQIR